MTPKTIDDFMRGHVIAHCWMKTKHRDSDESLSTFFGRCRRCGVIHLLRRFQW